LGKPLLPKSKAVWTNGVRSGVHGPVSELAKATPMTLVELEATASAVKNMAHL